jgi:hypothetical protein
VPRVSRLLALALRLDRLVRAGAIADYATLARLGHVSRARVSQILSLVQLAPDLQETLLFLPPTERGRDAIRLRQLQAIEFRLTAAGDEDVGTLGDELPQLLNCRCLWKTLICDLAFCLSLSGQPFWNSDLRVRNPDRDSVYCFEGAFSASCRMITFLANVWSKRRVRQSPTKNDRSSPQFSA